MHFLDNVYPATIKNNGMIFDKLNFIYELY